MTLGLTPQQVGLFGSTAAFCGPRVAPDSIYGLLHRDGARLFPDEMFADLFTDVGRRSVPPQIVAVVMVLQRIEGCSDREAVDRFCFDARWKYAAGGLDFDYPGFVHTVLVDMRARLAGSEAPDRIFEAVLEVARAAGLVGRKRVLDSTPIYDAVATMDTVTLVRSAIRGVLKCAGTLEDRIRAVLARDDDYATPGKPVCDWDDAPARAALVDALAKDGTAVLGVLDGQELPDALTQAGQLLATVLGQDLDEDADGVFTIARRVAKDRVISTVDPEARHGHKTAARSFDGYKGHVSVDPDSEIITDTEVTAGNEGDASVAADLIDDLLTQPETAQPESAESNTAESHTTEGEVADDGGHDESTDEQAACDTAADETDQTEHGREDTDSGTDSGAASKRGAEKPAVYGDNAYGTGPFHDLLEREGIGDRCKTQHPVNRGGRLTKDAFDVDLEHEQVTCPAGQAAPIQRDNDGVGTARFGPACAHCPLREQCTTSASGRTISVGAYERQLTDARTRQQDPEWVADYRGTRPKVERKIGHTMRRKHGGRRARVRGRVKVDADFSLLAAAVNLARLSVLAVAHVPGQGWAVTAA